MWSVGLADQQRLGELLVVRGALREEQLALVQFEHERTGRPVGELVLAFGFASWDDVNAALEDLPGWSTPTRSLINALDGGESPMPATRDLRLPGSDHESVPPTSERPPLMPPVSAAHPTTSVRSKASESRPVDAPLFAGPRPTESAMGPAAAHEAGDAETTSALHEPVTRTGLPHTPRLDAGAPPDSAVIAQITPAEESRVEREPADARQPGEDGAAQERCHSDVDVAELRSRLAAARAKRIATRDTLASSRQQSDAVTYRPAAEQARDGRPHRPKPNHHLLLLPTAAGYQLIERQGAAPPVGTTVELPCDDGARRYTVVKATKAPLPASDLLCVYLQAEFPA